ncbi:N-acetylmuramidase domain-containing protein [Paraglaciecola sp.]|uniref:N-acetylmuramidase domain-containing protein n=1 Tax=Paraglaciecola sp. TaxID=1920173 RepID=UPI0030F43404
MLSAVSIPTLNVRSMPQTNSAVVGQLCAGTVVWGDRPHNGWVQIPYAGALGFVSARYLQAVDDLVRLSGKVNVEALNVRQSPAVTAKVLTTLALGASVKILTVLNDWLEIECNGKPAYVASKFIDLVYAVSGDYAIVNVATLNVRSAPSVGADLLGQLSLASQVWVEGKQLDWSQLCFNGNPAYVKSEYLEVDNSAVAKDTASIVALNVLPQSPAISLAEHVQTFASLTPLILLTVSGNSEQRNVASTWNQWGALLQDLSDKKQLDVACALAVLCVESSGKGFEQTNRDKMIIRFENHKFWTYWGKNNAEQFRQHFCYNTDKVWTDHKWRSDPDGEWQSFHGKQTTEWQVFEFARQLNADAAMLSISMGAPQIMGFHYKRIGYQTVEAMFTAFSRNIESQITGLFDFFSPSMLSHLREMAFEEFAGMYNGKGQKQVYGSKIQQHFTAFKTFVPK